MYEYAPKPRKRLEKAALILSLLMAAALYGISRPEEIRFPAVYQLLAVLFLVAAVMLTTRYLIRNYVYRVEPRSGAGEGEPLDLVVTELTGKRASVVCRISLAEIVSVSREMPENRKRLEEERAGKHFYRYTAAFRPADACIVCAAGEEEPFFLRLCADERLFLILSGHREQ